MAYGVAVDSWGNVYVADTENHVIRKLTPTNAEKTLYTVSTIAGDGTSGDRDGPGTAPDTGARFTSPWGVAVNSSGNVVYVADSSNSRIRKIVYQ